MGWIPEAFLLRISVRLQLKFNGMSREDRQDEGEQEEGQPQRISHGGKRHVDCITRLRNLTLVYIVQYANILHNGELAKLLNILYSCQLWVSGVNFTRDVSADRIYIQ